MKARLLTLLTFLVVALTAWADTTFRLQAPSAVAAGQQFRIEYVLTARGSNIKADFSNSGLEVLYGPSQSSSQSTSIVNGQVSSETRTTFSYVLIAKKEGTYSLPAAMVQCDGKTLTSNNATLKVLPADKEDSANQQSHRNNSDNVGSSNASKDVKENCHLVLDLSKTSAYEGEAIVATLKLYWRSNQMGNPSEVKLPDFEGFTVQEIQDDNAQATLEHYNGQNYSMYPLAKWVLFPSRTGEITIPAASLTANVQVVTTRRSGGFFDWPMEYAQNVAVPLQTAPRKINVKELPSGKPASYMNAVGDFSIKSELTATEFRTGDAFIYRITIDGSGNLKFTREPEPQFPTDFEVFDPKVDLQARTSAAGQSGRKVIEYTIIPRHSGEFDIPAVDFSYFDIKSGKFQTVSTQPYHIKVERGANDESSSSSSAVDYMGTNQERIKVLGSDVRYIHKLDADDLTKQTEPLFGSFSYWLMFIIPLLLFIVVLFIYRRQLRLNADVVGKRTRKAGRLAEKRLKDAARALKENDNNAFYEAIHKAMLGYVSDKLRIPMADLSLDNVCQTLRQHNVSEDTIAQTRDILETCEFARYAPSQDSSARDTLYTKASDTLDHLEDEIKK